MSDPLCALTDYKLLGHSGLRVSPLCLGTMTFGPDWGWGADMDESRRIFERYAENGGNFVDTANLYTNGTSESFLGEFLKGRREKFVLATKYTMSVERGDPNAAGNHRKNLRQTVDGSLKRLQTDYIDLLYLHAWEYRTPIEEVMRSLDDLVRQGKVLYIGFSDTPAWKLSQANTMAALRGWEPLVAYQIEYSLLERTPEREMMPMAREFDVAVLPWSPLAGGMLAGKYKRGETGITPEQRGRDKNRRGMQAGKASDWHFDIVDEVVKIAGEIERSPSQVALNWLFQQPGVTSTIIGCRRLDQLEDNLGALTFTLTREHMDRLDSVSRIQMGFPHDFLAKKFIQDNLAGGMNVERRDP